VASLEVDLVATDRKVWSGEATMVSAPAADGDIGVLVGHEPVLSLLRPGTVRIRGLDGVMYRAAVDGGILSIDSDKVTVVVDNAEVVGEPAEGH
jgi:F-type H+-transporting ATPase subunit epsilon